MRGSEKGARSDYRNSRTSPHRLRSARVPGVAGQGGWTVSIADDMREAAEIIDAISVDMDAACAQDYLARCERLRQHAETIERVVAEMRVHHRSAAVMIEHVQSWADALEAKEE